MEVLQKNKSLVFIFLVSLALIIIWFRNGLLFAGGEESLALYDPSRALELFSTIWYKSATGYPLIVNLPRVPYFAFASLAQTIGFSNVLIQALTFLVLLLLSGWSMYFLTKLTIAKELPGNKKLNISLISAIFYMLNPYSMNQIWGRGLTVQFFTYALTPLFLTIFIYGLLKKKILFSFLSGITGFVFSIAFSNPAMVLTVWFPVLCYALFYLLNDKKNFGFLIKYLFCWILFWILGNFFWIYPYLKIGESILSYNLARNDNISSLMGVSIHTPFFTVLRLLHNGSFFVDKIYGDIYTSIWFKLFSFIIPLVSFLSLKYFKLLSHIKYFVFIFLISIFISIGSNPPTGNILITLFEKIPILQVMRNPYEKFGTNLVISLAPLFALGIIVLKEKLGRLVAFSTIVLVSFVFVWPMWNGSFAGGIKFNPWVEVPAYYREANNWLNQIPGEFKILHVPINPGDGVRYTWPHSFQGIEPSEFLFDKASISRDNFRYKDYYTEFIERFGRTREGGYYAGRPKDSEFFKETNLSDELAKLNVRYIVLHNDLDTAFTGTTSPEETEKVLALDQNINKVKTFGELDLYEVKLSPKVQEVYSPEVNLTFSRKKTTEYNIFAQNVYTPFNLYLLEQFDPNWATYVNGKRIDNHEIVFSYANKWLIKETGNLSVTIRYTPEEAVGDAFKISFLSVLIFSLLFIPLFLRNLSARA